MKHKTYFENFLKEEVNLNETRIKLLEERTEAITNFLKDELDGYRESSTQGSYALKTIIKPVKDNDEFDADILIFIRDDNFNPDQFKANYVDYLYRILKASGTYKDKVERKTRCVRINYAGDFHIDLVPCVEYKEECYICNRKDEKYEKTDGDGYKKWLREKNDITSGNNLRKVTKLLKYLRNYKKTFSVASILLTTLLGNKIEDSDKDSEKFEDLPTALKTLSNQVDEFLQENYIMPTIKNPVLIEENFNRHWDQEKYENFREKFHSYTQKINEAYDEEDDKESVKKWQKIFGDDFGDSKKNSTDNSGAASVASTVAVTEGEAVPATKPWLDEGSYGGLKLEYSDSELQKIEKQFPGSSIRYDKNKNSIYMNLKITPCHYIKGKNPIWMIEKCDINQEKVVEGEYSIEIMLENRKVFELSGKIKKIAKELGKSNSDLHINDDNSCCLRIDIERRKKTLSEFILQDAYPYFVWQAYHAKYKKIPPVGQLSHGDKGKREAADDYRQTMVHPRKAGAHRNEPCPCGSGKKYKNCCWHLDNAKNINLMKFQRTKKSNRQENNYS